MYSRLKHLLKKILPYRFILNHELKFRYLLYLYYQGRTYYCNICNSGLRRFIRLHDGDRLCPRCGSISRNRRLWELLQHDFTKPGLKILDFSPSRCLYRKLKDLCFISYIPTDLSGDFLADKRFDITQIELSDETIDLIICYHILEHVLNDKKAMDELYRVLKTDGVCMLQTPFREGKTYEDPSISLPGDRFRHFGQQDHVRVYSADGLKERLVTAGFHVKLKEYESVHNNRLGMNEREYILIATK